MDMLYGETTAKYNNFAEYQLTLVNFQTMTNGKAAGLIGSQRASQVQAFPKRLLFYN